MNDRSGDVQSFRSLSHLGAFTAHVRDGAIIDITPFEHDPRPNKLINVWQEMVTAPNRIKKPSFRKGWLAARGQEPRQMHGVRGEDEFVELAWDEALPLIAGEIQRIIATHGNSAMFGGSYGWSSAGRFHHARTLVHRFMYALGGCTGQVTNYSYGAAMVLLPHVLGSADAVTGNVTDLNEVAAHCDHVLAFGGIVSKNWEIHSGGSGRHMFGDWVAALEKRNVRLTNISPLKSDLDALPSDWLPIRPGSDTALLLALAYQVEKSGNTDQQFLDKYTVGYDKFIAYVKGETDGVAKTPAWAEALTGIPQQQIIELAQSLTGKRVMITATWSLQRAQHGEQPYWAIIALSAMLGQVGLPGAGFAFGYGSIGGFGNPDYRTPLSGMTPPTLDSDVKIPVGRLSEMLLNPGATVPFDGKTLTYPDIRLVYWAGGNPFHHHQDLNRLKQAFQKPETIIVHEPWWTATAKHADIVLPATTPLERNDIGGSSHDKYILAMQKAIEPYADARDDFVIFSQLADLLGAGECFHENRDEQQWLRHLYGRTTDRLNARGIELEPFDQFWHKGYAELPEPEKPYNYLAAFRDDPQQNPLATPSGKIELFSQVIADFAYDDCAGHAMWYPPSEWLGAKSQAYPLHLITNQPAEKIHSQLDASSLSQAAKVSGRTEILLSSRDAERRGLSNGQVVVVWNDRGSCLAGVTISDEIMQGVVRMATGATFAPQLSGGMDKHGNPNILTADIGSSQLSQGCSALTCLVDVKAFEGEIPEIYAFETPVICSTAGAMR